MERGSAPPKKRQRLARLPREQSQAPAPARRPPFAAFRARQRGKRNAETAPSIETRQSDLPDELAAAVPDSAVPRAPLSAGPTIETHMSELPSETGQRDGLQESDTDSDRPTVEMGDGHSAEAFRSDRPTVELTESKSTEQSPSARPRRPPPLPRRRQRPLSSLPNLELSLSEPPEEVARLAELPPLPEPPPAAANQGAAPQPPLLELDSFPPAEPAQFLAASVRS